jgi:four helix bundle protein
MELETHMIITQKLRYLSQEQLGAIQKEVEEIGKMLNGLIPISERAIAHESSALIPES